MRKLLFAFALLCTITAQGQQLFTAPLPHWQGQPTGAPSSQGSRVRYDLLSNDLYTWVSANSTWAQYSKGIDRISGTIAPAYTPNAGQSDWAVNGANPPELYYWTGSVWLRANPVGSNITAGDGIAIVGTPPDITISNTGILDVVAGADISVSVSGGVATVTATGDGNGIYGGSGTVPDGTAATVGSNGRLEFGGDDPDKIALAWRDAVAGINQVVSVGAAGIDFRAEYDDGVNPTQSVIFGANSSTASFASDKSSIEFNTKGGAILFSAPDVSLVFDDSGAAPELKINDDRAVPNGLIYVGDYSDAIIANDPSLTDVRTVKKMLGSSTTVTGATSTHANAAAITAGLSAGQPYRWDDGSSIHLMFVR